VYLRYFSPLKLQQRVAHSRLVRICFNDYDREIALVAEERDANGESQIVGVGRISKLHSTNAAEFAVVVTDRCQRKGLGTELTKRLEEIAKNEKLDRLVAYTLR
jgi:acetyltransferase